MSTESMRLSEMVNEERVIFLSGYETKAAIIEALCGTFNHLSSDHMINAVWHGEHRSAHPVVPGIRFFPAKSPRLAAFGWRWVSRGKRRSITISMRMSGSFCSFLSRMASGL